jgi:hypothetical protein
LTRSPEVRSDALGDFVAALKQAQFPRKKQGAKPCRIQVDPEKVEQGLVKLVLALVEFLRQILEKQAIRKMESGSLTKEEIDRLGTTLMKLEEKIKELQEHFAIDDLNINLGPLGNLID